MKQQLVIFILLFLACILIRASGYHFVLIHGASHGAWCWYKIHHLLSNKGHIVSALDLKSAGIDSNDPNLIQSFVEYTQPLVDFMTDLPESEKVAIVGHSLGGLSLAYIAELFPAKILACIYVAALGTPHGLSTDDITILLNGTPNNESTFIYANHTSNQPTSVFFNNISQTLYNESPDEDIVLASSLLKPLPYQAYVNAYFNSTSSNFGSVPRFYVRTIKDHALSPTLQSYFIDQLQPQLVFNLSKKSDHSPFFSTPFELEKLLLHVLSNVSP